MPILFAILNVPLTPEASLTIVGRRVAPFRRMLQVVGSPPHLSHPLPQTAAGLRPQPRPQPLPCPAVSSGPTGVAAEAQIPPFHAASDQNRAPFTSPRNTNQSEPKIFQTSSSTSFHLLKTKSVSEEELNSVKNPDANPDPEPGLFGLELSVNFASTKKEDLES